MMEPTKNGDWEYVKEMSATVTKDAGEDQEELDDLWEDMNKDKLDNLDPDDTSFTIPLIGGNTAAIKRLTNDESVENLSLQV